MQWFMTCRLFHLFLQHNCYFSQLCLIQIVVDFFKKEVFLVLLICLIEIMRQFASSFTGILAAGTNMGNIAMWKYSPPFAAGMKKIEGESKWKLQAPSTVEGPVRQLQVSFIYIQFIIIQVMNKTYAINLLFQKIFLF